VPQDGAAQQSTAGRHLLQHLLVAQHSTAAKHSKAKRSRGAKHLIQHLLLSLRIQLQHHHSGGDPLDEGRHLLGGLQRVRRGSAKAGVDLMR